jgi:hypothetical protein
MNPPENSNEEIFLRGYSDQAELQADLRLELETAIAARDAAIAECAALRAERWSNPYALMLDPIPFVMDISSEAGWSSKSVTRVDIPVVKEAVNFKAKQKAYTLSIKHDFEQREDIEKYHTRDFEVASLKEVYAVLLWVVFAVLDRLVSGVTSASAGVAGISVNAHAATFITSTKETVVLYQIRRGNLVLDSEEMVRCWEPVRGQAQPRRSHALDALQQLAGYLVEQKCRFGILTSYQYFWAVELCENGDVLVSPAYASSDRGENSVMSMLCYVIHVARDSIKNGGTFTPPQLPRLNTWDPTPKDGDKDLHDGLGGGIASAGTKDTSVIATSHHWSWRPEDGFEVLRFLVVDQKDRITLQVRLLDGPSLPSRLAVVKAYDTAEGRDREVRCYRALERLKASGSVPLLFNGDLMLHWPDPDERRVHALVLEWVGPPDAKAGGHFNPPPLPDAALVRVREILEEMHECGVAHYDIRPANVLYEPSTGRVVIFDFSHSSTRDETEQHEVFAARCRDDLQCVDLL